ncbi:MAG: glucosaminidase domain-containing protein [Bacteroidales bacterium]
MKYLHCKVAICAILLIFFSSSIIAQKITREQYISTYKDIAIHQMKIYGIPASIILAQACLESGNGNSRLALKANNHFGIKCHDTWKGKRLYNDDDEKGECFRKYNNPEDSYKDHSEFLKNGRRYQSLFDIKKTDYKAWAHGLKAAGYATNPKYAPMLIEIIEKNELYKYDSNWASLKSEYNANKEREKELRLQKKAERAQNKAARKAAKEAKRAARKAAKNNTIAASVVAPTVIGATTATKVSTTVGIINEQPQGVIAENTESLAPLKSSNLYRYSMDRQIYEENNVPYIIATQGDTYSIIAKEYNLFTGEVLSFNDLKKDVTIETGTIVYIKRKKKLGTDNTYVVASGETMYFISQKKGIRLESLYELNKMYIGTEPETGTILNLRK